MAARRHRLSIFAALLLSSVLVVACATAPAAIAPTAVPPTVALTLIADGQTRALTWQAGAALDNFADTFRASSFLIAQRELTPDGWRL